MTNPCTGPMPPPVQRNPRTVISVPPMPPPVRYASRFSGQWLTATSLLGPWRPLPHPDQGLPSGTWHVLPVGLSDFEALDWLVSARVGERESTKSDE